MISMYNIFQTIPELVLLQLYLGKIAPVLFKLDDGANCISFLGAFQMMDVCDRPFGHVSGLFLSMHLSKIPGMRFSL